MSSLRWLIVAAALTASSAFCADEPPAATDATPTRLGGVEELQWLEAPDGERALAWARAATAASRAKLTASPSYAPILRQLQQTLAAAPAVAEVSLLGPYAVRLYRDAAHPKGLLQRADRGARALGAWTTMLDIGALSAAERADYDLRWNAQSCLPPLFERCLLSLGVAGSDDAVLREFDLALGRFVEGGFSLPASRHTAAWLDRDTIVVAHDLAGAPRTVAHWPAEARIWRRGAKLSGAERVFAAGPSDVLFQLHTLDGGGRALLLQAIDFSTFVLHVIGADGVTARLDLPAKLKIFGFQGATTRHVFVQLARSASVAGILVPAEAILSYDLNPAAPARSRVAVVYTPAAGEVISSVGFNATRTRVIFPVRAGMKVRLLAAHYDGDAWRTTALMSADAGVDVRVTGADPAGEDLALFKEGFLVPPTAELLRQDGSASIVAQSPHVFDASQLWVETRRARAVDGETIDYFVVGPKRRTSRPVPTLMTGYGAFGISLLPAYPTTASGQMYGGATLALWLERGGALVLAAIRGGGERGEAWHIAAMREKRQISYDDFHAVAADVIRSGLTDAKHLGVFGTSNGGLLAAVAALQRPDLFGAVVSDAPLADMLRFPEMGIGAAWIEEYGDPRNPVAAASLARYSPLHIVRAEVDYPPFLITVSATDNRVGPGHARKLAKRLQDAGANVFLLEAEAGGHALSDPLLRPDIMAMRAAFLVDRLHR